MSYSTAYLIQANGTIEHVAEFRNGWGFGPFVWAAVADKYLGPETNFLQDERLWPLWKDQRLPKAWRAAMLVTFDHAIIEKARFKEFAEYLRQFVLDVGLRDRACHFLAVADLLDKHVTDDVRGMCFHGTSVSECPWHPWDHDKDEAVPYNFDAPGKHYFVGEELDASEREQPRGAPPPAPSGSTR